MKPKALPTAFLLGFVLAVAVAGGIWGAALLDAQDDYPAVAPGEYRYYSVSVPAPPQPLRIDRLPALPSDPGKGYGHRAHLIIHDPTTEEADVLVVDAITGEVLHDTLSVSWPDETASLIAGTRLHTELPDVWPFVDVAAPSEVQRLEGLVYPVPPPESGIIIYQSFGYCSYPCGAALTIAFPSAMTPGSISFNALTGEQQHEAENWEDTDPAVQAALIRFAESVVFDAGSVTQDGS